MGILSWDKLLHFGAYFGYGILMQIAVIPNATKKNKKYQIFIVILLSALFAVSDEIHQSFVPGRDADLFDVLADLLGALTSLLLYRRIEQIFKKERADE
jgi:VanZ family protein